MSALCRKRPSYSADFGGFNVRYTPNSGPSGNIDLNYRFVPFADIADWSKDAGFS